MIIFKQNELSHAIRIELEWVKISEMKKVIDSLIDEQTIIRKAIDFYENLGMYEDF